MRYHCDGCGRLVALERFSVEDGALAVTCPECGAVSRSGVRGGSPEARLLPRADGSSGAPEGSRQQESGTAAPAAPGGDVIALARGSAPVPQARCPKCGATHDAEASACQRCGLVFALYKPEDFKLPPPIEALWTAAEAGWQEPGVHESFVAACESAQLLPEAVRRYRLRALERPDDPIAAQWRDQLVQKLCVVVPPLPLGSQQRLSAGEGRLLLPVTIALVLALSVGTLFAVRWMFGP